MVQAFVSCVTAGNVKVQWNVSHALGNLFINDTMKLKKMSWASAVYSIILLLLRDSTNFKIRIHATVALSVPASRLENVFNLCNFPNLTGMKYRNVRQGIQEAVVCGLYRSGKIDFHPNDDEEIKPTDKVLFIAPVYGKRKVQIMLPSVSIDHLSASQNSTENKLSANMVQVKKAWLENIVKRPPRSSSKTSDSNLGPRECVLLVGWRSSVGHMIREYDNYLGPGSLLVITLFRGSSTTPQVQGAQCREFEDIVQCITFVFLEVFV